MKKNNTSQYPDQKKPIAPILKQLKVNQSEIYPVSRYKAVKASASLEGLDLGMTFKTSLNRQEGIVIVTRIA